MGVIDATVVGLGLVSPAGFTPRDHVFFLRAGGSAVSERAFVDEGGEPLGVIHCPWIDPARPLGDRLAALATEALTTALAPLREHAPSAKVPLFLTLSPFDEAFGEDDASRLESELAGQGVVADPAARIFGEAGFFRALERAIERLDRGDTPAVVVACVDSSVDPQVILARATEPSPWDRAPLYLSEASAALVLTRSAEGPVSMGRLRYASTERGTSNDDNLEPVDGTAMTKLVRRAVAATTAKVRHAFGPRGVSRLRGREWSYAVTRNSERFDSECTDECIEDLVGRVGAASGGLHLVYGLAAALHGVTPGGGPIIAWSISRDGTRGLCLAEAAT